MRRCIPRVFVVVTARLGRTTVSESMSKSSVINYDYQLQQCRKRPISASRDKSRVLSDLIEKLFKTMIVRLRPGPN